jgi:ABC-type iron transport system FetAB ATPase subunit
MKTGRGVRLGCCLSLILFSLHNQHLTKEALEVSGNFKRGGQVIRTVRYADDLVLLPKEGTALQGMIDSLNE